MPSSVMQTKAETMALCIVRDVHEYTGGRQQNWAPLETIVRRLVLTDEAVIVDALALGVDRGWLLVEGGHSVALTDEGRRACE